MKEHNSRVAVRLPSKTKRQMKDLVKMGKFRNLSEAIRSALLEFLSEETSENG